MGRARQSGRKANCFERGAGGSPTLSTSASMIAKRAMHQSSSRTAAVLSFGFGFVVGALLAPVIKKRGIRDGTDEPAGEVMVGLQAAEAEMEAVFQNILVRCLGDPNEHPEQATKLTEAQKAWVAFREAHIAAIYPEGDELGAVASLRRADIQAALTRERTRQLREWWE